MTAARHSIALLLLIAAFAPAEARAAGGRYVFVGGRDAARAQVRAALEASSFDWDVVRETVDTQIADCGCAGARPGLIVLDERLLAKAPYGVAYTWSIVQHEYAHQVWDLALDDRARAVLADRLGGEGLCWEPELADDERTCERFADTLAWAYWRDPLNPSRYAKAMRAGPFRELMAGLLDRSAGLRLHDAAVRVIS